MALHIHDAELPLPGAPQLCIAQEAAADELLALIVGMLRTCQEEQ